MGAHSCGNIPGQRSDSILDINKFNYGEKSFQADIQVKQQFDNPSRGIVFKCLNNQLISASNNLLTKESRNAINNKSSSCVLYDSIKQQPQKTRNKQIKKNKNKIKRCSIDHSFLSQLSKNSNNWTQMFVVPQSSAIEEIKSFIISQKNLYQSYQRAEIKLQDFIKLKKMPIRKQYKFQQKIGQGSYGNVYKGTCIRTKQTRAIKSIKQKTMPQQKRNQFILQMDILRQLDHPNIIKLFQVFQDLSMYHVVTQYCRGGSIIDFVVSRKKYSQKIIRTIFQQLLSAINYLHSLKIVHRDLKLENLVFLNFVSENTQISEIDIKLIDFGTATRLKNPINFCPSLVGTTSYMAPEIIGGYYNQKCDIWSSGIILYILLIGRSPFKSTNKEETLRRIQNNELTFNEPQWANISKLAIDLLQKMLVKDPQKRISAQQALNHRWFQQVKSGKNLILQNKDLVQNLSKYYRGNNFISKIQSYLTFVKVTQQQRKKISEMFRLLDKNNDGTIEVQELRTAYNCFSDDDQNINELEYIVNKVDKNKSGKIDLSEFTAAIYDRKKLFVNDYLIEAFQYFDSDGTGFIQKSEFHSLLEGCQKKEIQQILKEIDSNGDSRISKQQFLDYFLKRNFLYKN